MFKVVVVILKALARLPLRVLYVLADVLYVLIYYVVRYRRRLVRRNLTGSFPDKTAREIKRIEREFYHNFADYVVETIKLLHISDDEMRHRVRFEGLDIVTRLLDERRSVVAYFAHCGNWEWAPSITLSCERQVAEGVRFCQIYRPLRNRHFDALMLHVRSRFGSESIAKKVTLRRLLELRREGVPSITGFMSDQKPSHGDAVHVVDFMHRRTAVITGTETLARRLGMAVVYWDMSKPSRGHYTIRVRLIADDISAMPQGAVTDTYFKLLQETIDRQPSIWLWSHNRWKTAIPPTDNERQQ